MYNIRYGDRLVSVDFNGKGVVVSLDGITATRESTNPTDIVDAVRDVVSKVVQTEQLLIDQQRAVEDAQRMLGSTNTPRKFMGVRR